MCCTDRPENSPGAPMTHVTRQRPPHRRPRHAHARGGAAPGRHARRERQPSTRSASSCCLPAGWSWRAPLKAEGKHVFLDMKLLDIGNTVERAVANATRVRRRFPHRARARPEDAAGGGGRSGQQPPEAARRDRAHQPDGRRPRSSRARRCRLPISSCCAPQLAHESGFDGVIASGQEASRIREATGPAS